MAAENGGLGGNEVSAAADTAEAPKPAPPGRAGRLLRASEGARHPLFIIALVTGVLALVYLLVASAYSSRAGYYHERNLRELDRLKATIESATDTLSAVPSLHLAPAQLHFSLSPQTGCLIATASIGGGSSRPIDITYHFVPLAEERAAAEPASASPPPSPADTAAGPDGVPKPPQRCVYRKLVPGNTISLSDQLVSVKETIRLRTVLWPTTFPGAGAREPSGCSGPPSATMASREDFVIACFREAARAHLEADPPPIPAEEVRRIAEFSLRTAETNGGVQVQVTTSSESLDLTRALETFDAVLLVGESKSGNRRPTVLFQAGQIPPLIEEAEAGLSVSFLASLLAEDQAKAKKRSERPDQPSRTSATAGSPADSLLMESSIHRTDGLVIFQKKYAKLGSLSCGEAQPCRLIGVMADRKFDRTVRRIGGYQATGFLIGVLSIIGLLPLIHLALRKRLDPMGPATQYIIWFSLTLMSASAAITGLTFWSNTAARHSSDRSSLAAIETLRSRFHSEIKSWVGQIHQARAGLGRSEELFPAPETFPRTDRGADHPANKAAATLLEGKSPGVIETVEYFRRDGYNAPDRQRVALNRFPAFGTNIRDRAYFARALRNDWDRLAPDEGENAKTAEFVIDRVLARPDAMVKTIMLVPAHDAEARRAQPERPAAPDFVLSAGHLQTFLSAATAPGFEYAVIDPTRPAGKPNVLFHSRSDAELVEWFQNELDGDRRFAALVDKALASPEGRKYTCIPREGQRLSKDCPDQTLHLSTYYRAEPVRLSLTRLHPSLDWIVILIEQRSDAGTAAWRAASFGYGTWLLTLLMLLLFNLAARTANPRALDRRPGMWLWPRTALTDFTTFRSAEERYSHTDIYKATHRRNQHIAGVCLFGALNVLAAEGISRTFAALGVVMAGYAARAYFRGSTAHDRSACRRLDLYSVRLAWLLLGASLIAAVTILIADFRELGPDSGRLEWGILRSLLYVVSLAALGRALLKAGWFAKNGRAEPAADETFGAAGAEAPQAAGAPTPGSEDPRDDGTPPRVRDLLVRAVRSVVDRFRRSRRPAEPQEAAGPSSPPPEDERPSGRDSTASPEPAPVPDEAESSGRKPVGKAIRLIVRKLHLGKRAAAIRLVRGWMLVPLLAGAVPAAAGYLDSIDHDFALVEERASHLLFRACEQRRALLSRINETRPRLRAIPKAVHDNILAPTMIAPASGFTGNCGREEEPTGQADRHDKWRTAAGLAMSYPALHDRALEFSDRVPFHMRDTWVEDPVEMTFTLFVMLLPFILVALTYAYFRKQYFPRSPQAPPGKAGDLEPPLTCSRPCFIEALLEVAQGRRPTRAGARPEPLLPFRSVPERRHVVLGVDLDLREEPQLAGTGNRIAWIDMLRTGDITPAISAYARAVVIGNLDIALQLKDDRKRLLEVLEEIVGTGDDPALQERYVFLLAAIEPLDRIALLRERTAEERISPVQDLRWASLLQDFALCAVTPPQPQPLRTLAERELLVINTRFAQALFDSLPNELRHVRLSDSKEESLVAYVAEQLGDYYHKLWASSSDEERVLLYHLAWRFHLKMQDSRALRSLLSRGLIVRTPEYRLMNRSFARYVRRVERGELIHRRAAGANGVDQIWPLIRYPLAALVAALLIVLQLVAPSQSSGTVGLLPALGAAIPALLGNWMRGKNVQA